jgi:hypothetical protein
MRRLRASLALFVASAPLACTDAPPTPPPVDAASDLGDVASDLGDAPPDKTPVMCQPRTFEAGTAEGDANPLTVPAGGVRAGRLEAAELPADRTGLTYARAGDYVLANERIALVVESARTSAGYDPWGGKPAGVARLAGGRLVDAGDFNEMMLGLGRYTVATESVTVLRDGTSGGTAVVRAVGPMRPIPFIDEFGRTIISANYNDVRAAIDYELRPGSDHVDVYATYDVQNEFGYNAMFVTHAFFQGYRMARFFPGFGFFGTGDDAAAPPTNTVAWIDDDATSWAWQIPNGMLTQFISLSGFDLFNAPAQRVGGCTAPLERTLLGRIVIGGRGLDGLQQALARDAGRNLREIRGTVTDGAGRPAEGVRVHATGAMRTVGMASFREGLTRATTDATGAFTLHVPADQAVELSAFRRGEAVVTGVAVPASQATANIRLAASGAIRVVASEMGAMGGLPVRVQVIPTGAMPAALPESLGETAMPAGRLHVDFPTNGETTLRAPPGTYRVVVSRGYEYDLSDTMVTVTAGATAEVRATLRRVVDTAGVQCGDFHIHTTRSPDSRDSGRFKLAAAAGDGLEVPARSEHEYIAEWSSTITEMGLSRWLYGITSLELTTFAWGHFGVLPLSVDPARRNGGVFDWAGRPPPAVFADVRARAEQPALIINHPRGAAISGYFTAAGYNAMTGRASRPDLWDDTFTAVEFFNDSGFYDNNNRESVADWYSFLNRGRRVAAVGSSDSHSLLGNSPVGFPRTCMYVGTDDPAMLTPNGVRDAVRGGRSYISGGVYLDATAVAAGGMAGPGQELRGAGPTARLQLRVQAAPWITTDRLEVIVNGAVAQTIALDASRRDPMNPTVRFRGEVMVDVPAAGAWVIVAARGAELAPVHPGRNAFGVTNPIYLMR